jgi:hypothetical protein
LKFDGIWLDMNEVGQFSDGAYISDYNDNRFCDLENKKYPYLLA